MGDLRQKVWSILVRPTYTITSSPTTPIPYTGVCKGPKSESGVDYTLSGGDPWFMYKDQQGKTEWTSFLEAKDIYTAKVLEIGYANVKMIEVVPTTILAEPSK